MYSILCDFDGTLIMDNGQIDNNYLDMLKDICNNNHLCILSSSSYYELLKFKEKYSLKLDIFSLSSNIALINNELIVNRLPKEIINTLINAFNKDIYTAYSESEYDTVIIKYQDRLDPFYPKNNRKILSVVNDDRPSFTFAISNDIVQGFISRLNRLRLSYTSIAKDKNREIITVFNKHVSKSDGYYMLKDKYNDEKIIGISDSSFDYDMMLKCDIKIAMKNADLKLKKCSQIITKYDNNNSGAIRALYDICHLK